MPTAADQFSVFMCKWNAAGGDKNKSLSLLFDQMPSACVSTFSPDAQNISAGEAKTWWNKSLPQREGLDLYGYTPPSNYIIPSSAIATVPTAESASDLRRRLSDTETTPVYTDYAVVSLPDWNAKHNIINPSLKAAAFKELH